MNKAEALEILAKYCPTLTLSDAAALIVELSGLESTKELTPTEWVESVFSWSDKRSHKIKMIKAVRNRFSLGLKEAKDIVDDCTPCAGSDYYPPRDEYPQTYNY